MSIGAGVGPHYGTMDGGVERRRVAPAVRSRAFIVVACFRRETTLERRVNPGKGPADGATSGRVRGP